MTGCHIRGKIKSGNSRMGKNTPQAMGKDVLGSSMPHPGVIPGPGGSSSVRLCLQFSYIPIFHPPITGRPALVFPILLVVDLVLDWH